MKKLVLMWFVLLVTLMGATAANARDIAFQNRYAKLVIGEDGRVLGIIDRAAGANFAATGPDCRIAAVRQGGKTFAATSVAQGPEGLQITFGDSGINAIVKVEAKRDYFTFQVASVSTNAVDELTFVNISVLEGKARCAWAALQMNLHTRVASLPGSGTQMVANCIPQFGLAGAKCAVILAPRDKMRAIMKQVVTTARNDVPYSPYGGPWALDHKITKASYVMDCVQMREDTVDGWIKICHDTGIRQIDISNWNFYAGDYEVSTSAIPGGKPALKRIIGKLHAAGIKCGLHTYSFLVQKQNPKYVTPVPDPRLAKAATFTLASDVDAAGATIPVSESTAQLADASADRTLVIDNELVSFSGVSRSAPFALTGCGRGALGTKAVSHKAGAHVGILKEVYDMFMPDVNTSLFKEVAHNIASTCNEYGFDMTYLDAMDAYSMLDGDVTGDYWATEFVNEIVKNLKKPALMEAATMWPGFWFARSRMGAWDVPIRGMKDCTDLHCAANRECERVFLPGHLGWCNAFTWNPVQPERTFPDDIEYLCSKCAAWDCGLSMQWYFNPASFLNSYNAQRLGGIIKSWEDLRMAGRFTEPIRARLKVPGDEYTLEQRNGQPVLKQVVYARHKVQGADTSSRAWRVTNRFRPQPVQIRVESLMSIAPYDSPDGVTLGGLASATPADQTPNTTGSFQTGSFPDLGRPETLVCFKAKASGPAPAWVSYRTDVLPVVDADKKGLGVWIWGDGQGEVLDFQTDAPQPQSSGMTGHFAKVDFRGWRYFEFVEPDMAEAVKYDWPGSPRKAAWDSGRAPASLGAAFWHYIMFGPVNSIRSLRLWYNNLPAGKDVTTYISPVKALPLVSGKLVNPAVVVNGQKIVFPVTLESGQYLEFRSMDDCKVFDAEGKLAAQGIRPIGPVPVAARGTNQVQFQCDDNGGSRPRANVTVITKGDPITIR